MGRIQTCDSSEVPEVRVQWKTEKSTADSDTPVTFDKNRAFTKSDSDGFFKLTVPDSLKCYSIVPYKNDNALEGIDAYDLLLIQKHIFGIRALDSPYKLIAADVNKSNNISSIDIEELRRLILGIDSSFRYNTSWRFLDKHALIKDTSHPFADSPLCESRRCVEPGTSDCDFLAVKTGDVGSCRKEYQFSDSLLVTIEWPDKPEAIGDYLIVPVFWALMPGKTLEAIQFALRFDTTKLEYINVAEGETGGFNAHSMNLLHAEQGEIKALWLYDAAALGRLNKKRTMFILIFKQKNVTVEKMPMTLDDGLLQGKGWYENGIECRVRQRANNSGESVVPQDITARIFPNPVQDSTYLDVESRTVSKARIALQDIAGNRIFIRDVSVATGSQKLAVPETAYLKSGVYIWKLIMPRFTMKGILIKN